MKEYNVVVIILLSFNILPGNICRSIIVGTTKEPQQAQATVVDNSVFLQHHHHDHPNVQLFKYDNIRLQPNYQQLLVQEQSFPGTPHVITPSIHPSTLIAHQQTLDHLKAVLASNPLLAAAVLSTSLDITPQPYEPHPHSGVTVPSLNHPQHLPPNPYVALLLSHYGRYVTGPYNRGARGLYGNNAANNLHNNQPFGSYKIYKDVDV